MFLQVQGVRNEMQALRVEMRQQHQDLLASSRATLTTRTGRPSSTGLP